jgi:hypothetical protein
VVGAGAVVEEVADHQVASMDLTGVVDMEVMGAAMPPLAEHGDILEAAEDITVATVDIMAVAEDIMGPTVDIMAGIIEDFSGMAVGDSVLDLTWIHFYMDILITQILIITILIILILIIPILIHPIIILRKTRI